MASLEMILVAEWWNYLQGGWRRTPDLLSLIAEGRIRDKLYWHVNLVSGEVLTCTFFTMWKATLCFRNATFFWPFVAYFLMSCCSLLNNSQSACDSLFLRFLTSENLNISEFALANGILCTHNNVLHDSAVMQTFCLLKELLCIGGNVYCSILHTEDKAVASR